MRWIKYLMAVAALALVAACGGGGGSAGTTTGGAANQGPTAKVKDFSLFISKSTLQNAGTDTATISVIAVDAANNVVSGATVQATADANGVLAPTSATTDQSGKWSASVSAGGNQSNRQIVLTVTINGISKQTSIQVVGAQLDVSTTPAVLAPGGSANLVARLTDATGSPVKNATVAFSGDIPSLAGRSGTTDNNGRLTLDFTAPASQGSYVVNVSGGGLSKQLSLQVSTGSTIPAVTLPGGAAPSLSASPAVLAPNVAGSTANQSALRFLFLDANNNPVSNVRVRFEIVSNGLGSTDSTISTGATTVYTNASGVATAAFIPGTTASPTDGVTVRACYQGTEFTSPTQCVQSVAITLIIAQQALAVSIGNDNLLQKGNGTYLKEFVVTVADSAGRAVPNAPVDISVDLTHYGKGSFTPTYSVTFPSPGLYAPDAITDPATYGARVWCANEDTNRNGFVDPGENINGSVDSFGQPTLEPRKSDLLISYSDPNVRTTNASGILLIRVEYSQRYATWLAYRIRASTSVAGSQGSAERTFITSYVEGDDVNGSFRAAPYGSGACNRSN